MALGRNLNEGTLPLHAIPYTSYLNTPLQFYEKMSRQLLQTRQKDKQNLRIFLKITHVQIRERAAPVYGNSYP